MKTKKLHNIFLPIWIIWLVPQVLLLCAIVNFVIDSLVVLLLFKVLHVAQQTGQPVKTMYKESIGKVWLFGFLADFVAVAPLILIMFQSSMLPGSVVEQIAANPFGNPISFLMVLTTILIGGVIIYLFNYYFGLKKVITDQGLRQKMSIGLGAITMPWFFLFPSTLIY